MVYKKYIYMCDIKELRWLIYIKTHYTDAIIYICKKIYGIGVDIQLFIIAIICLKIKSRNNYCCLYIVH